MTDSNMPDRRVTFQDAHPDKGDDVVLCKLCGETLHAPEDDVFWEETANHACIAPVADAELDDLVDRLQAEADGAEFSNRYADLVGEAARAITALRARTAQPVGVRVKRQEAAQLLLDMLYKRNGAHDDLSQQEVEDMWRDVNDREGFVAVNAFLSALLPEGGA